MTIEATMQCVREVSDEQGDMRQLVLDLGEDRDAARALAADLLCDCGHVKPSQDGALSPSAHSTDCRYRKQLTRMKAFLADPPERATFEAALSHGSGLPAGFVDQDPDGLG